MKKNRSTIFLILLFLTGLSVLLYPTVSDYWNSAHQSRAIASYDSASENLTKRENDRAIKDAVIYNERIRHVKYPFMNWQDVPGYEETLNIGGTGIMGYVNIPKIGVELPIYHTMSDDVLNVAVGHMPGSSFPTGGKNTHCVISAHRGLPRAKLFTDLDKLEIGDQFQITVLDRNLAYQVDQILIVEPSQVDALYVQPSQDYCTLVTCTPYAVNSHRMLVRGVRIDSMDGGQGPIHISPEGELIQPVMVAPFLAVPLLIILLLKISVKGKQRKINRNETIFLDPAEAPEKDFQGHGDDDTDEIV